ncbi:Uncharacterised protein [Klebsiella pneumoniae]|uniref:hypothetical protein n=1 Tax=Klebsiella pneumoniae TaxID=573 RepID=UPI000E2AB6CC|nr:hypothetical protein [Klebsiella pneumoniae]SXB50456.1 Uncharacterised protein [Klebsiella pneumoniae]SXB85921.1 Uncharacterised protein [Klebsiella pneumoniae]
MKRALLLIAIIALAGCKPSADKAIELAKREIAADTRDPDSSKFRYVRFIKKQDTQDGAIAGYVCGQINGKNAFGAYSGFTPFMLEIKMKSKGIFSNSVTYSVYDKQIFTEFGRSTPYSYSSICGTDE